MAKQITETELWELIDPEIRDSAKATITRWLDRGDGCAVYEDHDFGSFDLGHKKFVSFGSPAAQIETPDAPDRLPDIGNAINWRYVLIATVRR